MSPSENSVGHLMGHSVCVCVCVCVCVSFSSRFCGPHGQQRNKNMTPDKEKNFLCTHQQIVCHSIQKCVEQSQFRNCDFCCIAVVSAVT